VESCLKGLSPSRSTKRRQLYRWWRICLKLWSTCTSTMWSIEILSQRTFFLRQIKSSIKLKLLILVHLLLLRMEKSLMRNSEHLTTLLQKSFKKIMELNAIFGQLVLLLSLFYLVFHHLMVRQTKKSWKKLSSESSISMIQFGKLFQTNAKISFLNFLLSTKMLDHLLNKHLSTHGWNKLTIK